MEVKIQSFAEMGKMKCGLIPVSMEIDSHTNNHFFEMIVISERKEIFCYVIVYFFYFLSNFAAVISQTIKLTIAKDHSEIRLKLDTNEFRRKNSQRIIFI